MRSEYEPPDIEANNDNRSAQIIQVETGRHVAAVAICAVICGMSVVVAMWCVDRFATISAAYEKSQTDMGTEYRLQLNHYMDLEAKQKVMADEIQELKHVRR
jgi:hypothetical protein